MHGGLKKGLGSMGSSMRNLGGSMSPPKMPSFKRPSSPFGRKSPTPVEEAPSEEPQQEPVQRSRGRRNRNPAKNEQPEAKKLEEDSDVLLAFGALLKTNDPAAAAAHASYERHEDQARFIEDARRLLAMSPSERKAMVQRAPPGMAMAFLSDGDMASKRRASSMNLAWSSCLS